MSSDESSTGGDSILSLSDSAFSPIDVPVHPFRPPTPPPPAPVNNLTDEASSAPASDPISDSWKDEYDARVANWRAESAEARTKAEAERAKWEELRASGHVPEHETWESVGPGGGTEPEVVSSESTSTAVDAPGAAIGSQAHGSVADEVNAPPVTSVADARDLVSGEKGGGNGAEVLGQNTLGYPPSATSIRTLETSDVDASPVNLSGAELSANEGGNNTWEEVHSLGSSFPSLPEQHNTNAIPLQPTYRPRPAAPKKEKEHHHRHSHHPPAPAPPPSLTLSIFDSSLPTRARVIALFSSLAINMFLPFVNGVMLGFGEIFARNVIGPWFGWPKPVATSVGVRASRDKKRS